MGTEVSVEVFVRGGEIAAGPRSGREREGAPAGADPLDVDDFVWTPGHRRSADRARCGRPCPDEKAGCGGLYAHGDRGFRSGG